VLLSAIPLLLLYRLASMYRFNQLNGYWRYTGVRDLVDILKSVALGSVGFVFTLRYCLNVKSFPLSIYILEALLTTALLGGVRLLFRHRMTTQHRRRRDDGDKRVLVVGAGDAAESLIRELPRGGYLPVGCIDDDPAKLHFTVHGVPVLGTTSDIPAVTSKYLIDEVLIATPSASGAEMRRIVDACQRSGRIYKTVPGLLDLVDGKVSVRQLRDVNLEDLLGRDPIAINLEAVRNQIQGKAVLITGAAGSIGSELCRQVLDYGPAKLICLDQAETPLFYLQQGFKDHPAASRASYVVADVCDTKYMRNCLLEHGVQVIFHAAAYKHVPLMESNLSEALKNNVFGLMRLLDAANASGCEHFLLISSDKAVHPTSFMGCTKRLGELIVAARPASGMRCLSVRFGNVLGSQGSVVPLFQEQIRSQRRVTVTHPDITRYFMTIPEAVSLVLQAFTVGRHGDVLVLDMGEPIRIVDLAKTLIRLSGHSDDQVDVVFSGLRPGEKLYEDLFYANEAQLPTSHKKVRCAHADRMSWAQLAQHLAELQFLALDGSASTIRAKVKDIIPEYTYPIPILPTYPLPLPDSAARIRPSPRMLAADVTGSA
jgi:FlaA1/EpsC-like NDP-sugar epimerase